MVAASRLDPLPRRMLWLAASLPLLSTAVAHADEPTPEAASSEQVTLTYSADPGCPSEVQFVDQILARVRRPVRFAEAGAAIEMVVTLQLGGETAMGKLEVRREPGEPTRREFTGATCREVGSALALVAALSLDPNARTEELPPAGTELTSPLATEPAVAPAPAAPPPARQPPRSPAPPQPTRPARPTTHYVGWIGPAADVVVGEAPKALGLFGLSLGVRAVTGHTFAPSLQLSPLWGATGATGPSSTDGGFEWGLGRLEACPVSVHLATRLRLDPCGVLEVGRVRAEGDASAVDEPVAVSRWWVAPGASASLHWDGHGWFARLGGLALAPATRDEFVFLTPERRVHQASTVVVGAHLALGFQLGEGSN